jgi:transposase, IS5 family
MIRYKSSKQLNLEGFILPFGGKLKAENRWVKWSQVIPWDDLAKGYYQTMNSSQGRPCKDARLVIGSLIIKHKLNLSDEETVLQIQENPYLQYFVGFSGFRDEQPFAPSLFVEIRKRMGKEVFASFENTILEKIGKSKPTPREPLQNSGKLLVDATVAEQSVKYPTDISLLNEAREISENIIDELYGLSDWSKKPRTYRQKARRQYLVVAKNKRPSLKVRRRSIREQLQYLRRNLGHISNLLDYLGSSPFPFPYKLQRKYWIIQLVYEQQDGMYRSRKNRCDNRVISISQPHIRPIVRGKAGKRTELGAKISVSMTDGLAFVDHIGWEAFSESKDLKQQVEEYKQRYGFFPEVVLGDQLYGSRENRNYLKERGIRFGGKALGWPKKKTAENAEELRLEKQQRVQDSRERIPIEGKFGQGKNGYRLNYIRARLQKTSEAWINSIFLVMNLMVLLRELYEKLKVTPHLNLFCLVELFTVRLIHFTTKEFYPKQVSALGRL